MNASRPIHVAFNIFHVPDSNRSKTQAEMQEMRSEVGSAMKSVLLGTFSDDDNAQDCNIVALYVRKFWWGIYFGGLVVLRAIRQYFIYQNLQCDIIIIAKS